MSLKILEINLSAPTRTMFTVGMEDVNTSGALYGTIRERKRVVYWGYKKITP